MQGIRNSILISRKLVKISKKFQRKRFLSPAESVMNRDMQFIFSIIFHKLFMRFHYSDEKI